MKKYKLISLALIASALIAGNSSATGYVEPVVGDPTQEPVKIRATLYTDAGTTYSGQPVRKGIIAGCKEWQGKVAMIWSVDPDADIEAGEYPVGDFLGYYEVLDYGAGIDTDGDGIGDTIPNGQSIDIYCETEDEVRAWQKENGDYVYIMLFDGVG